MTDDWSQALHDAGVRVRAKRKPVILIDTREQAPLVFSDAVDVRVVGLKSGDYGIEPPVLEPKVRRRRTRRGKTDPADVAPPHGALAVAADGVVERAEHPRLAVEMRPPTLFAAVERKSLDDLVGCVVRERVGPDGKVNGSRERFERELARLSCYGHKAIVVEASLEQVWLKQRVANAKALLKTEQDDAERWRIVSAIERWEMDTYRADVAPAAVEASCVAWHLKYGVPTIWAGSPAGASRWVERFLVMAWRYRDEQERRSIVGASVKTCHVGEDGALMQVGDGI